MKILILVITITWSFGTPYPPPQSLIVSSPEQAAIYIYNDRKASSLFIEPDKKKYTLFSVNLETKKITEVAIPNVIFQLPGERMTK